MSARPFLLVRSYSSVPVRSCSSAIVLNVLPARTCPIVPARPSPVAHLLGSSPARLLNCPPASAASRPRCVPPTRLLSPQYHLPTCLTTRLPTCRARFRFLLPMLPLARLPMDP